jgi:thimet oligopeptidase
VAVPPVWKSPEAVASDCQRHLASATKLRDGLRANAAPTVEGTLVPMNAVLLEVDRVMGLAELMSAVHPDKPVREASEKCHQQVQKFLSDLELDRQVYDSLVAVDVAKLDPAAKRFVERLL